MTLRSSDRDTGQHGVNARQETAKRFRGIEQCLMSVRHSLRRTSSSKYEPLLSLSPLEADEGALSKLYKAALSLIFTPDLDFKLVSIPSSFTMVAGFQ